MSKIWIAVIALVQAAAPLSAACYKCEIIREENKKLPPPKHEYYEDYLEELKAEGKETPGAIEFLDESPAEDVSLNKEKEE